MAPTLRSIRSYRTLRSVGATAARRSDELERRTRCGVTPSRAELDRSYDTARVGEVRPERALGVEVLELLDEIGEGARLELASPARLRRRAEVEPVHDRPQVQTRAADEQRDGTVGVDRLDGRTGVALVVGGRELFVGVDEVEAVVRDGGTIFGAGLRGADVETAVDLHGVAAHDLDRAAADGEASRDLERHGALAGSGGPGNREQHRVRIGAHATMAPVR